MDFPGVLISSKKWWDGISGEDRVLIKKVYKKAELWGIETQAKAEKSNLEKLKKDGVIVTNIDLSSFKKVGQKIRENYVSKNNVINDFYSQSKDKK